MTTQGVVHFRVYIMLAMMKRSKLNAAVGVKALFMTLQGAVFL